MGSVASYLRKGEGIASTQRPAGEDRPEIVEVIARAGELVREHTLRAYDAIHLATALREEASELLAQREPAEESPQ